MKSTEVSRGGIVYSCDKTEKKVRADLKKKVSRVLISSTCINKKISSIAGMISRDARKSKVRGLEAVVVLKGGAVFANKLAQEIFKKGGPPINFNYIKASSYGKGMSSSGKVRISGELGDVKGKDVLVIDDIVDTGLTLTNLKSYLTKELGASSVKVCALLNKPAGRVKGVSGQVKIDYLGFNVPDVFVAGYGIDCAEELRELPYIVAVDKNYFGTVCKTKRLAA